MDDTATILLIISIISLIFATPLLLYYGRSYPLEIIFITGIILGIIGCIILIYQRTPNLENVARITSPNNNILYDEDIVNDSNNMLYNDSDNINQNIGNQTNDF